MKEARTTHPFLVPCEYSDYTLSAQTTPVFSRREGLRHSRRVIPIVSADGLKSIAANVAKNVQDNVRRSRPLPRRALHHAAALIATTAGAAA